MAKSAAYPEVIKSKFGDSPLSSLFGGSRKTLFLDAHPLGGISSKTIGIKTGNLFYDLKKEKLEYADGTWDVEANFKDKELDLKKKIDGNVGVSCGWGSPSVGPYLGGKWKFGGSNSANLKVFVGETLRDSASMKAELSVQADISSLKIATDINLSTPDIIKSAVVGASYQLPGSGCGNTHVGGMLKYPEMNTSLGLFTDAFSVPGTKKANFGLEIHSAAPSPLSGILLGAEFKVDNQLTLTAKSGVSGRAEISATQQLSGVQLRTAIEADLASFSAGKFGACVKVSK